MESKKLVICRDRAIRFGFTALLCVVLAVLPSCIIGVRETPPPGAPNVKIAAPSNNVPAGEVEVKVEVSNFNIADREGDTNRWGEGHLIFYVDVPVPTYYDHPAITVGGTYKALANTSYTWKDVTPGEHTFSVQLVNNDNKPLPAPAVDSVTINVTAPRGSPGIQIQTPKDGSDLPPGIIIVSVQVSNFIVSHKDMGPVNRTGEGHLIYYIDEDPPTDRGAPAVTETSIVSTSLGQQWKSIPEGQHTFVVQLVNNDDSPLDLPVTAKVTINVKPSS